MNNGSQRCQASTLAGRQCKNAAAGGSQYCHIHQDRADVTPRKREGTRPSAAGTHLQPSARLQINRFRNYILGRAEQ